MRRWIRSNWPTNSVSTIVWEVEHHFLEEYSHSSAPEVFLAACSQRTKRISALGHGVMLMSPNYNHPARAAERIAALDLVSKGRVEWGTGESASALEMEGFMQNPDNKTALWAEGAEQAANMLAMTPYPGFKGEYLLHAHAQHRAQAGAEAAPADVARLLAP